VYFLYSFVLLELRALSRRLPGAAAKWTKILLSQDAQDYLKHLKHEMVKEERLICFGSLVEYVSCVNAVRKVTVHYDHWKYIRFFQILVLFSCCYL
jgi:hypothetical protein